MIEHNFILFFLKFPLREKVLIKFEFIIFLRVVEIFIFN